MSKERLKNCIVPSCSHNNRTFSDIFYFPQEINKRNEWLRVLKVDPSKYSTKTCLYICGNHFELSSDLENFSTYKPGTCRNKFKTHVVPHKNIATGLENVADVVHPIPLLDETRNTEFLKVTKGKICYAKKNNLNSKKPENHEHNQQHISSGTANNCNRNQNRIFGNQSFDFMKSTGNAVQGTFIPQTIEVCNNQNVEQLTPAPEIPIRKRSKEPPKKKRRINSDFQEQSESKYFTEEQLEGMKELLPPPTADKAKQITEKLYGDYHKLSESCAVCGQFCDETEWVSIAGLPKKFFEILSFRDIENPLQEQLVSQYDISALFKNDERFKNVLLNANGVKAKTGDDDQESTENVLSICVEHGCYGSLKRGKLPKFAIVNGNYFGRMPEELRQMTHASLSLIRPVQSFGFLVSYYETKGNEGSMKLTGHMYSTRLETATIRSKLPLSPQDAEIRVLVTSPGCKPENILARGKIASLKKEYVVEREKIKSSLQFFKDVDNKVMSEIEIDYEQLKELPNGEISNVIFRIDDSPIETRKRKKNTNKENNLVVDPSNQQDNVRNETVTNNESELGGPSLFRCNEDYINSIPLNATVTVGEDLDSDLNRNEQVIQALSQDKTEIWKQQKSDTYVVRPKKDFADDFNPLYLEKHYPDLLPFGRGGFGEFRCIPISRKALIAYMLNLSTRQFQHPSFVLPTYNLLVREGMATKAFLRTRLPTSLFKSDGTVMHRGEAFSKIPIADLKQAAEYQRRCAATSKKGLPLPAAPVGLRNNLAPEFFTDMRISNEVMQHSEAAARRDRQNTYAAHASNGKADIWFTITPDDTKSFQVHYYAFEKGTEDRLIAPPSSFRFETVAKHPVAAALNNAKVMKLVVKHILGWDKKHNLPFKTGGTFGIVKAYLRATEEQGRGTVHSHWLIWLADHTNLENQIEAAKQKDNLLSTHTPFEDRGNTAVPSNLQDLLARLAGNLDNYSCQELLLPEEEILFASKCSRNLCFGSLKISGKQAFLQMRQRQSGKPESDILQCDVCKETCSITSKIEETLEHGYQRCFQKPRLIEEEITQLMWQGLPPQPPLLPKTIHDRWLLQLASIQSVINVHDWKHRGSCFKKGQKECRYHMPRQPVEKTNVKIEIEKENVTQGLISNIIIEIRRRIPFLNIADANVSLQAIFACNNYVRYVEDQKISMYLGAYVTKGSTENETATATLINTISNYDLKIKKNEEELARKNRLTAARLDLDETIETATPSARSAASIGLGRLLSAARSSTNGETIGATMAAHIALGNKVFDMSHETVPLPINQAIAFLKNEPLFASINKYGSLYATIFDYVYRSDRFSDMNYWQFLSTQENCKIKSSNKKKTMTSGRNTTTEREDSDSTTATDDERNGPTGRDVHSFLMGHPMYGTHGHRKRMQVRWPKCYGKRLPDTNNLFSSQQTTENPSEDQETYGQYVLIMFQPFRKIRDVLLYPVTSWWHSYLLKKHEILQNENTAQILNNFQNYYESFCRSTETIPDIEQESFKAFLTKDDQLAVDEDEQQHPVIQIDSIIPNQYILNEDLTNEDNLAPFVKALSRFQNPLISINTQNIPEKYINKAEAEKAVAQLLESQKKKNFKLPGRAALDGLLTNNRQQDGNHPQNEKTNSYTTVELLSKIEEAFQLHTINLFETQNWDGEPSLPADCPTLQSHAKAWNLNEEQWHSFLLMGAALLKHTYTNLEEQLTPTSTNIINQRKDTMHYLNKILPPEGQLIFFLCGSAGTGKTQIIKAYIDFGRRWNAMASSVVCASTGAAAVLIDGFTLHAVLGLQRTSKPPDPSQEQLVAWSEVGVIFIDEFSMIPAPLYDLMDARLRKLKNRPDARFGGLHVIHCGDFYQLPPVGSKIFKNTDTTNVSKGKNNQLATIRARQKWETYLTDVIELKINMRIKDEKWAAIVERAKTNDFTAQDIADINSRALQYDLLNEEGQLYPPPGTPAAVAKNVTREQTLRFCIFQMLSEKPPIIDNDNNWHGRGILLIQANLSRTRRNILSSQQERHIRNLPADKLGAVGNLFLILGAPYMMGQNNDVAHGIANGTVGYLQDVILQEGAAVRIVQLTEHLQIHAVYAEEVACAIYKHKLERWSKKSCFPALPVGSFPIIPQQNTMTHKLGIQDNQQITVKVKQLPCELAICLTGHKFQGQTMVTIILGDLGTRYQFGADGWLYVILARVKEQAALYTAVRLHPDPRKYKPRTDVNNEMKRLRVIETATLERLRNLPAS